MGTAVDSPVSLSPSSRRSFHPGHPSTLLSPDALQTPSNPSLLYVSPPPGLLSLPCPTDLVMASINASINHMLGPALGTGHH